MRKLFLILVFLASACIFAPKSHAQTATYEWSATACNGNPCYINVFQSARATHATDPIIIEYGGGGWTSLGVGCPQRATNAINTCFDYTYWTNQGYNVLQVDYPIATGGVTMNTIQAGAACAMSWAAANLSSVGNFNEVVFEGDSAGGPLAFTVGAAPNSQFLTGCPSQSTAWTTVGFILIVAPGCESARTNCFCDPNLTDNPNYDSAKCTTIFGALPNSSNPTAQAMAEASSPDQYLTCTGCWQAKGSPPIVLIWAPADAVISPAIEQELNTAVVAAGGHTSMSACTGLGHGCDFGTLATVTACNSFPINFLTAPAACHQTTDCKYGATCNVWGQFVEPAITQRFWTKPSASSGNSSSSAGGPQ
jgi:acetyl esterase/lipase